MKMEVDMTTYMVNVMDMIIKKMMKSHKIIVM